MKKPLLFLIATVCSIFYAKSQSKNSDCLNFSAGLSLPVGSFAASDIGDRSAGFAKPGVHLSLAWSKLTSQNFGFTISFSGQQNPVYLNSLLNQTAVSNTLGSFGSEITDTAFHSVRVKYNNWNYKNASWLTASLQAGAYCELPLNASHKFKVLGKLTAGALYAKLPAISATAATDTSNILISQSSGSAVGFSYSIGTGVKYLLNNKISLLSSVNYFGTPAIKFNNISAVINQVTNSGTAGGSFSQSQTTGSTLQSFSILTVSLGIGLQL